MSRIHHIMIQRKYQQVLNIIVKHQRLKLLSKKKRRAGLWLKIVSGKSWILHCKFPFIPILSFHLIVICLMLNTDESVHSDGEKEDASTGTYHHFKASTVSQSSTRGRLQAKMCMDSEDRPDISCRHGKVLGKVTLHQRNNTVCDLAPSLEKKMKSNQRIAVDDCTAQERSTALQPEAEPIETKLSALYQTVCKSNNLLLCDMRWSSIWKWGRLTICVGSYRILPLIINCAHYL